MAKVIIAMSPVILSTITDATAPIEFLTSLETLYIRKASPPIVVGKKLLKKKPI